MSGKRGKKSDDIRVETQQLENVIEREYSNHRDQLSGSQPPPERIAQLEISLVQAYKNVIEYRQVPFICFGDMNAQELANAFVAYPIIVKPTLSCVNVAQRAVSRDLGFEIDTYSTKITPGQALILAGYIKPFLPPTIAVPALMELDRYFWTDKELRAQKGNWEKTVTDAINKIARVEFRKRQFTCDGQDFEIDAAYPSKDGTIQFGIDIKRIESPRDIHKRADEIINKAGKFKRSFPEAKFIAVVYYPFPTEHLNAQSRIHSSFIDDIVFAGATGSSINHTAELLVGKLDLKKI